MNSKILQILTGMLFTGLFLISCKKWDDHNAVTDPKAEKDLLQQISEDPELGRFAELLTKSGYDKVIASSKTYTVYAPSNSALATLDPAIVADSARLRMFVGNHIANQLYPTTSVNGQLRLQMLSGKYNNVQVKLLEDANITAADKYAKNGLLHIIDKMVPALPNAWQFLESGSLSPVKQKNYMLSLFGKVFDTTNAEQIGVDPGTGRPIYKPGTDSVNTNFFWRNVHDLRDESKQFTFFILADAAWDTEINKFKPFFVTGTADSTTNLSSNAVVQDLAVEGVYQPGSIPDTIISKFNVKVGIEKSAIVQTIKVSNGIVYIMTRMNVLPKHRFQQYIIQGENYNFTRIDRRGNTFFRDKLNPLTGKEFRDVLVFNHGVSEFYLGYLLPNVPSLKYKAYWVALNDNVNNYTGNFSQRLGIGTFNSTRLPYVAVTPNNYSEVLLGEFTLSTYFPVLEIFLTAAANTTNNTSMVTADYIRLEPVL
ncbi:MAG: fasciclin domain-containing protein [Chitinophagaceae bacterium]|nr:fasciclin domain-containing protein [Chitinophagaceae bacterium]